MNHENRIHIHGDPTHTMNGILFIWKKGEIWKFPGKWEEIEKAILSEEMAQKGRG